MVGATDKWERADGVYTFATDSMAHCVVLHDIIVGISLYSLCLGVIVMRRCLD